MNIEYNKNLELNKKLKKINYKDFKFWYKFICSFLFFLAFWIEIITIIINTSIGNDGNGQKIFKYDNSEIFIYTKDIGDQIVSFFCYFTILSNIFCFIWFVYNIFNFEKEGKKKNILSPYVSLAFGLYILVTGIIYNFILLPYIMPTTVLSWFSTIIEHQIIPIAFIIYLFCFYNYKNLKIYNNELISLKDFSFKYLYKLFLYFPIPWLIFNIIRSEFRLHSGVKAKEYNPYLYFFMNLSNLNVSKNLPIPHWLFFILFVIILIIVCSCIAILFFWVMKKNSEIVIKKTS